MAEVALEARQLVVVIMTGRMVLIQYLIALLQPVAVMVRGGITQVVDGLVARAALAEAKVEQAVVRLLLAIRHQQLHHKETMAD